MSEISRLCDEIVLRNISLGLRLKESLLPGATASQLTLAESKLPFVFPESVRDLYEWSAGTRVDAGQGCEMFPGYFMENLNASVEMYITLSKAEEYPRFADQTFRWFPVFHGGGTDFYGVVCRHTRTIDEPVVDDLSDSDPKLEFLSLVSMLRTILAAYEEGVFYVGDSGRLTVGVKTYFDEGPLKGKLKAIDVSAYREIARRFNSGT